MRIFLDANILFSAGKSAGAIRQLLSDLTEAGHRLVVDEYVVIESRRNLSAKSAGDSVDDLEALVLRLEVNQVQQATSLASAAWLPEKDRPVLVAAIALKCDALVTGDRTHFGAGYEKTFEGVTIYSPAQLAAAIF